MRRLARLFGLFALVAACWPVALASALSYPVTSTVDTKVKGTLRASIEEANARPGADEIPIEVTGTIGLDGALPAITDDIAIVGPGADALTIRRESATAFRIFEFANGLTASLSGLTVTNGLATNGGGISNGNGSLNLAGVVVSGNEALATGGFGAVAFGGGIYSSGPLTLRDSTVWGNTATAEEHDFILKAGGGGIYAEESLTVDRSTVTDNEARAVDGFEEIDAFGGGIQGDQLTLTSSTVVRNSVETEGNAFGANLAITTTGLVRNTIVAHPIGADSCSKSLISGGFNLDEDSSCELDQATDLKAVDPMLGQLASNGGPTPTHALLASSPALDRGYSFGIAVDQRGLPRPVDLASAANAEGGDGSDIGAFELQPPPPPPPVLVTPVASDRQPPNTRIVSGPPRATYQRLAKFRFASSEPQSSFQCKVDGQRWRGCSNPFKRKVSAGRKHLFKVRAIDRFGNVDPTPARFGWRVKKAPA